MAVTTLTPLQINKLEDSAVGRAIQALSAFDSTQKSFVDFTTHLLHDVVRILLDSTIEQLEAYADLVANVSGSVAEFEMRMVGDQTAFEKRALEYLNSVIDPSFTSITFTPPATGVTAAVSGSPPNATTTYTPASIPFDKTKLDAATAAFGTASILVDDPNSTATPKPKVERDFTGLLHDATATPDAIPLATSDVIALSVAKLRQDVKGSYDKLVTILQVGMQKLTATEVEFKTALTWHLDATDTDEIASQNVEQSFDQRAVNWNVGRVGSRSSSLSGKLFGMTFGRTRGAVNTAGASGSRSRTEFKVQVVNEKKTAVTHLNVDITGSVTVHLKSETFPPITPPAVAA
jgi:hypothetical protein